MLLQALFYLLGMFLAYQAGRFTYRRGGNPYAAVLAAAALFCILKAAH